MSGETRLFPEDREPKAIKIRKPKHTKRNVILSVAAALLIIALGAGAWVFFGDAELPKLPVFSSENSSPESGISESLPEQSAPESLPESSVPEESSPEESLPEESTPEQPQEPEPDPIPRDEWYMLLVNKEHPVPPIFPLLQKQ